MESQEDNLIVELSMPEKKFAEILQHNKTLVWVSIILGVSLIFGSYFFSARKSAKEKDFLEFIALKAESASKAVPPSQELLSLGQRYPELRDQVRALIAKKASLQPLSSQQMAEFAYLSHHGEEADSPFNLFSHISVMILQGKLGDALQHSLVLKKRLLSSLSSTEKNRKLGANLQLLFISNLLRISFLERELGQIDGERATLAELNHIFQGDHQAPFIASNHVLNRFSEQFAQGRLSLKEVLEAREKTITKVEAHPYIPKL